MTLRGDVRRWRKLDAGAAAVGRDQRRAPSLSCFSVNFVGSPPISPPTPPISPLLAAYDPPLPLPHLSALRAIPLKTASSATSSLAERSSIASIALRSSSINRSSPTLPDQRAIVRVLGIRAVDGTWVKSNVFFESQM